MTMDANYECVHEEMLQDHNLKLKELEKEVQYKKEKIEYLKNKLEDVDEKLDKLIRQSEQSDFSIDTRVTKLETTQKTLKWVIAIGLTCIGTAVAVLAFIITIIH